MIFETDPQLGPLQDNGGPTLTHAPLPGSPLINAGDPAFSGPPLFDQRGEPFDRVAGGRIDIGAVELQGGAPAGARFLIPDIDDDALYTYDETGETLTTTPLDAGNAGSRGVATLDDGESRLVVDTDSNVYVYDASGVLTGQWGFTGVPNPQGITTDGTDVWIVSINTDRVYRFAGAAGFTTGSHAPTSSFALAANNGSSFGLTTDGASVWVVNDIANQWKMFKYTVAGALLGSWDLDPGNKNARGVTLDPSAPGDLLVVNDGAQDTVFRYENATGVVSGSLTAAESFLIDTENSTPHGLAALPAAGPALATASAPSPGPAEATEATAPAWWLAALQPAAFDQPGLAPLPEGSPPLRPDPSEALLLYYRLEEGAAEEPDPFGWYGSNDSDNADAADEFDAAFEALAPGPGAVRRAL